MFYDTAKNNHGLPRNPFKAIDGRGGVQRHVLGFEWGDGVAVLGEDAAQRCCQERFADVRAGSEDHDGACVAHEVPAD